MLPSLTDLGIKGSGFIRKLDNRNHWNAYQDNADMVSASQLVAEKVFREDGDRYSLWYISTDQELYGVVASLTANATPKDKNIDFIWIAESELKEVDIVFKRIPEGNCLHIKNLHFNAVINSTIAQRLCYTLMIGKRTAHRCQKAQTILILEHQQKLGCKATDVNSLNCECETW